MFLHCFLLEKIVFKCKNKRSYNDPDYFRTCFKSIIFNFGIKTLSDSFDGLLLKYLPNWSVWKKQVNFRFPCWSGGYIARKLINLTNTWMRQKYVLKFWKIWICEGWYWFLWYNKHKHISEYNSTNDFVFYIWQKCFVFKLYQLF